ncbi:MAG: hypothetical protein ACKV2Q_25530 [Planctomycetaceae bacterium]
MTQQVIVDENAGPGSPVWEQYQRTVGDSPVEYLFLKESHPGIPDVEILDKLLSRETTLLTGDRVLHMQAIALGFRSYTLNEQGQLTRKRLTGVLVSEPAQSVHRELKPDYRYQPTSDLPRILKSGMTEKELDKYRTVRRRIRSYFGSAAAIAQVSVTIGSQLTPRGLLCGFVFQLAGNSGVSGLRGREGYCLPTNGLVDPSYPVIQALRDLYLLQLDQVPTDVFVLSSDTLNLCRDLQDTTELTAPLHETLRRLIHGVSRLTWQPCVKGRFFDAMSRKLKQLSGGRSNEVTTFDFERLAASVLEGPLVL